MDKAQTINKFWESFGLPAYDETIVPDDAQLPYITYSVRTDSLDSQLTLNASVWYKGTSWQEVSQKVEEIAEYIDTLYPAAIKTDTGRLYLSRGVPFAQRVADSDRMIRRIYLIVNAEFLTEH